jgi:hypothetical protein
VPTALAGLRADEVHAVLAPNRVPAHADPDHGPGDCAAAGAGLAECTHGGIHGWRSEYGPVRAWGRGQIERGLGARGHVRGACGLAGAGASRAGRTVVVAGAMIVFVGVVAAAVAVASPEDPVLGDSGLRASLAAMRRRSSQRGRVNTCSFDVVHLIRFSPFRS